jgi:hypothetical protein
MSDWDNQYNEQPEPRAAICPRCNREVKNQEIGKARIDGEFAHVKCALEDMDEVGMDDFYD